MQNGICGLLKRVAFYLVRGKIIIRYISENLAEIVYTVCSPKLFDEIFCLQLRIC